METTVKVTLPEMGESVTEGSIVEWRKKVGEWINEGDTLVEVTTDKVDVEVPATASGVITALLAAEGDTVAVGASLAEIDPTAAKPAGGGSDAPNVAPQTANTATSAPAPSSYGSSGGGAAAPTRAGSQKATSRALSFAKEHNLDIASVKGSGPDGLISRLDVIRAAANGQAKALGSGNGAAAIVLPPVSGDGARYDD